VCTLVTMGSSSATDLEAKSAPVRAAAATLKDFMMFGDALLYGCWVIKLAGSNAASIDG